MSCSYGSFNIGNETAPYNGYASVRVTGVKTGSTVIVDNKCVVGFHLSLCPPLCVCACLLCSMPKAGALKLKSLFLYRVV